MRKIVSLIMASGFVLATTQIASAEPIEGTWKRTNGTLLKYSSAGGNKFCGKVLTGEFKGQSIGCLSGSGGSYKGTVNKLDEGKEYTGKGSVSGNTFTLSGCVAGGLICKSEKLKRQ